jgi:hypothetical protein
MEGIQLEIKGTLLGMLSTTMDKYKGKKFLVEIIESAKDHGPVWRYRS